jgi:hypothetical protein
MPQSIRSLIKDLTARHDYLAGLRGSFVSDDVLLQIDEELDRLQAEIDSLVETHAK